MRQDEDLAEAYRRADQGLRRMLLGDGMLEVGLVKGEEARARVTAALRQLRELFLQARGEAREPSTQSEAGTVELEQELHAVARSAASSDVRGRTDDRDRLLTPSEAAEELGISVSSVYRAIKSERITAVRSTDRTLRIPAGELERIRTSVRSSRGGATSASASRRS